MSTCDVCNASTSWQEGTTYTAAEFRRIVSQGFEPPEMATMLLMAMTGVSREQAVAQWKQGLVAQSTTSWLLCPSCAARAARYMPKPAGAEPADHKLVEPVTPEMLAPVTIDQEPSEEFEIGEAVEQELAPAEVPADLPVAEAAPDATKICPMCAETIKLEARVCRHCGTRFEVVEKGYCAQCRAVVEADESGRCQQCGSNVLDRRIESSLLEEPAPAPAKPELTQVLQIWEHKGEGVWHRFEAALFDGFVILGLSLALLGLITLLALLTVGMSTEQGSLGATVVLILSVGSLLTIPTIWFLYFTILEGTFGMTLGKLIGVYPATLKVVKKDGSRCGYLRAAVRAFLGLFETSLLGALVIWLTQQHQRIGDLIAGTLVVDTRKVLTVTFSPTPSVVFDFLDGRRVEFREIVRGDTQRWLNLNAMNLVGVTPQGRRMALSQTLPNARKREELRDELERRFQVRIAEHVQWWRLVLALVAVVIMGSCCLGVIVLAQPPSLEGGVPALFETAVPIWETAVAPLTQGTAVAPPTRPTGVPRRTPTVAATPAAGTATVQGRILWNDEPFAGVTVKLCSDWSLVGGCKGVEYQARSGDDGGYLIAGVAPGEYSFVTKMPGQANETKWIGVSVKLQADQTLTVRDVNVVKYDLKLTSPADKATVASSTPTLTWEPYPGAAYYKVYMSGGEPSKAVIDFEKVTTTQYEVKTPLGAGDYYWRVYAYNAGGTRIAEHYTAGSFTVVGP